MIKIVMNVPPTGPVKYGKQFNSIIMVSNYVECPQKYWLAIRLSMVIAFLHI